ncbi:hypothetical protein HK096_006823 [Nowakowskiella sp. JEL0078]|nr:hypothetical protein HK096_006823 [Nowakowskiella sp. JEL0078]
MSVSVQDFVSQRLRNLPSPPSQPVAAAANATPSVYSSHNRNFSDLPSPSAREWDKHHALLKASRLLSHDPFYNDVPYLDPVPSPAPPGKDGLLRFHHILGAPHPPLPDDLPFLSIRASLDISRISNRLITCGLPWDKDTDLHSHHNNISDLSRFLNTRYPNKYLIWNLAADTSYGDYNPSPFNNQILSFGMSKAFQLSIRTLFEICRSIHSWLTIDTTNVAIIHCANGVGRSGVAISCYLRFAEIFSDINEAFDFFQTCRTPFDKSWVSVSQLRFIQYFQNVILLNGNVPNAYPLRLHRLILNGVPRFHHGTCNPGLEIYQCGKLVFSTVDQQNIQSDTIYIDNDNIIFRIPTSRTLALEKDIQIRIFHIPETRGRSQQLHVMTIANFSFHTGFMPAGLVRVAMPDLEVSKKDVEDYRFVEGFSLDFIFSDVVSQTDLENGDEKGCTAVSYAKFLDKGVFRCLARLVGYHLVDAKPELLRLLEENGYPRILATLALQKSNNDIYEAQKYLKIQLNYLVQNAVPVNKKSSPKSGSAQYTIKRKSKRRTQHSAKDSLSRKDKYKVDAQVDKIEPKNDIYLSTSSENFKTSQSDLSRPTNGILSSKSSDSDFQYPNNISTTVRATDHHHKASNSSSPILPSPDFERSSSKDTISRMERLISATAPRPIRTQRSESAVASSEDNINTRYNEKLGSSMPASTLTRKAPKLEHKRHSRSNSGTSSSTDGLREKFQSHSRTNSSSSNNAQIIPSPSVRRMEELLEQIGHVEERQRSRETSLSRSNRGEREFVTLDRAPKGKDPMLEELSAYLRQIRAKKGETEDNDGELVSKPPLNLRTVENKPHSTQSLSLNLPITPTKSTKPSVPVIIYPLTSLSSTNNTPMAWPMPPIVLAAQETVETPEETPHQTSLLKLHMNRGNVTEDHPQSTIVHPTTIISQTEVQANFDDNDLDDALTPTPGSPASSRDSLYSSMSSHNSPLSSSNVQQKPRLSVSSSHSSSRSFSTRSLSPVIVQVQLTSTQPVGEMELGGSTSSLMPLLPSPPPLPPLPTVFGGPPPPPPLPPVFGGPPPPPPLPPTFGGLPQSPLVEGGESEPKLRARAKLHWNEIRNPQALEDSIWTEMAQELSTESDAFPGSLEAKPGSDQLVIGAIKLDVKKFEELFCVVPGTESGKPAASKPKILTTAQFTTVLDLRRSNNTSISLSQFTRRGLSNADISTAILNQDAMTLSADDLQALQVLLPTSDERRKISAIGTPVLPFAPAEAFMFETMAYPDFPQQLDAFLFRLQLGVEADELLDKLNRMLAVCLKIRSSENLKLLLKTVLQLGNLTNYNYAGAGYRPWMGKEARALGFKIDGLAKLRDVKSADGKWSLMNFLVDMILQSMSEVVAVIDEFADLKSIRNYDLREITSQIRRLQSTHSMLLTYNFTSPTYTSFVKPFLVNDATNLLAELQRTYLTFATAFADAARYFGEDLTEYASLTTPAMPIATQPTDDGKKLATHLFITLDLFIRAFADAVAHNRRVEEDERKRLAREQWAVEDRARRELRKAERLREQRGEEIVEMVRRFSVLQMEGDGGDGGRATTRLVMEGYGVDGLISADEDGEDVSDASTESED